jgi:hypothetical protein
VTDLTTRFIVFFFCCLFILLGAALIPYAGIQNDEALFTVPMYTLNSGHLQIPLMVMSYVGTLKTVLYLPIFAIAGANVWSLRLPMVLAGALTIWIFYRLSTRVSGPRAALMACALLATDPAFLLPDTFDWGPVALHQLLLVTACLVLVHSADHTVSNRTAYLALGFFVLGLALWNKAVFLWTLAGLFFGTLVVLRAEVQRLWRPPDVIFALSGFLLGAAPILIFNLQNPNVTLATTGHLETQNFERKLNAEYNTLTGSGVFGSITAEEWQDRPKEPWSRRGRAAQWIRNHFGEHRRDGLAYALVLSFLAVPFWWRSRAARFSLAFMLAAWLAMALTRGAGDAVHHAVLIWPFPHLFIGTVLASLPWRRVATLTCVVLVVLNLLVVNQHLLQLERDGADGPFTDALFTLSDAFPDPSGSAPEQPVYVVDWGMLNTLTFLHQGHLVLRTGYDPFLTETPAPLDLGIIQAMLSDSNAVFIGHVPSRQVMAGVPERLDRTLAKAGYEKQLIRVIPDSNRHPIFEIFRIRKIGT